MTKHIASSTKIVLIGFMGTGKSTVSKLLAERLGWVRIDIDEEIVRRSGKSIPELFAESGEEGFRDVETETLRATLSGLDGHAVIATGGGAVLRPENCEMMTAYGMVAALKADPEAIIHRVSSDTNRPLLEGDPAERVHKLLEARKSAYDFAHCIVDTTALTAEEVVDEIVAAWNNH